MTIVRAVSRRAMTTTLFRMWWECGGGYHHFLPVVLCPQCCAALSVRNKVPGGHELVDRGPVFADFVGGIPGGPQLHVRGPAFGAITGVKDVWVRKDMGTIHRKSGSPRSQGTMASMGSRCACRW